ncbi:MAG: VWA domain-containing protein [Alphaproteobacteria bacterium]|nr:VWA domain-containing protein [Alphaproteobacteria bacterium]
MLRSIGKTETSAEGGRMAENIMHFARVLRQAGLPVGPGKVLQALNAVEAVGLGSRKDFYWALHAVFVNRRDQREIFDQAFHFFWRNPNLLEKMMGMLLPTLTQEEDPAPPPKEEMSRRVAEALAGEKQGEEEDQAGEADEEALEFDATLTFSREEILSDKDFEKMSSAELEQARAAIRRLTLPLRQLPTRRFQPHPAGRRVDMRATLRQAARSGGDLSMLKRRKRRRRPPPLVLMCDISGSMDRYARMLLHFMHALTNDRDRVHTFLFGTRLTNITRYLRYKDPDAAIDMVSQGVDDWSGGTRIGASLHDFNRDWSRRVLGQGAVCILITDGLDREGAQGVAEEMERLHKSCRRLIWLNPLLRYEAYEPKAAGARAIIRHVDEFRAVHNLSSLHQLAAALGQESAADKAQMAKWRRLAA